MNLKNRLLKLEQARKSLRMPLVIVEFDGIVTSEQQHQIDEAEEGQMIMRVTFVEPVKKLT